MDVPSDCGNDENGVLIEALGVSPDDVDEDAELVDDCVFC